MEKTIEELMKELMKRLMAEREDLPDGSPWKERLQEDARSVRQMYLRRIIKNC